MSAYPNSIDFSKLPKNAEITLVTVVIEKEGKQFDKVSFYACGDAAITWQSYQSRSAQAQLNSRMKHTRTITRKLDAKGKDITEAKGN